MTTATSTTTVRGRAGGVCALLGAGIAILCGAYAAAARPASPMDNLPGYWTGRGSVILGNGNRESVKCAVTYSVAGGGSHLRQHLRCASPSYNINASAVLRVSGRRITGSWEERSFSASGSISGHVTGKGMALTIRGSSFSAGMTVALSSCHQSINITPQGFDIRRISVGLGKC
jgi:hypothetical protein